MISPEWPARVRERLRMWSNPGYFWRRLRHNLGPKMLSLLAALVLWWFSTGDQRALVQQSYDVPITRRDNTGGDEQRTISGLNPETVRVTLTGRPERLREVRATNIEAVVDVTGLPAGSFNRPLSVTPPADTRLSRLTPDRVQGFVDSQLTRTMTVTLSVAAPSEDSLPRYDVQPSRVQARAPSRVLEQVSRVTTSPVLLGAGEEREAPLIAFDAGGKVLEDVRLNPASVTVRRIDTGVLPIKLLPIKLQPPPEGLRVVSASLQPSTVRVVAAPELLARLREVSGRVEYQTGNYTLPVLLDLPAGAQALENVSVTLRVEQAAE